MIDLVDYYWRVAADASVASELTSALERVWSGSNGYYSGNAGCVGCNGFDGPATSDRSHCCRSSIGTLAISLITTEICW